MMCRSSVMDAVSTFKIHKIVTLVKIVYGSQLVTSAALRGVEIIAHIYSKLRTGGYIPRLVTL